MSAPMRNMENDELERVVPRARRLTVRRRPNRILQVFLVLLAVLVAAFVVVAVKGLGDLSRLQQTTQSISSQITQQSSILNRIQSDLARIGTILQSGMQEISLQLAKLLHLLDR